MRVCLEGHLSVVLALVLPLSFALTGCKDPVPATVEGQLGSSGLGQNQQGLRSEGGRLGQREQSLVVESEETAFDGITLELVEFRGFGEVTEIGVAGTTTPDASGAFAFETVTAMTRLPRDGAQAIGPGRYFVRITQPADVPVPYGAGGGFRWIEEGESLSLSLPVVTRIALPLWSVPANPPPPEQGITEVQLAADESAGRLVYLTPHRGLGVYDPTTQTVDTLKATTALDFVRRGTSLYRVGETDQAVIALHGNWDEPARFLLVDLDIFSDPSTSEFLDFDDPTVAASLVDQVTVIDVPAPIGLPEPPTRIENSASLRPHSFASANGSRFHVATEAGTWVIGLQTRTHLESWHDGARLSVHDAEAGLLYADLPGGLLRTRDASTGAIVRDLDLGARFLLGIAPLVGHGQTIVSYESATTSLEHRIAVLGSDGQVASDHLAGEYLGFIDRLWDPAYDWSACGPEYYRTPECPECQEPPPTGLPFPPGMGALHNVEMFFDAARDQLVLTHFGASFDRVDGTFRPRPFLMCSRFEMADECTGHAFHDAPNQVALIQSIYQPDISCIMHTDGTDLTVPVKIEGGHSGFSLPALLTGKGIGFVATQEALIAIHYGNAEVSTAAAVSDLTSEAP